MTSHDDDPFTPTAEERDRLAKAPAWLRDAPEQERRVFAWQMMRLMATAYSEGDITFDRARDIVWACALLSPVPGDHLQLLARVTRHAQLQPPDKTKRPDTRRVPTTIKRAAVFVIDWLQARHPDEPIVPVSGTSWLLEEALAWLRTVRLIEAPLTASTLYYEWYLPTGREMPREKVADEPAE